MVEKTFEQRMKGLSLQQAFALTGSSVWKDHRILMGPMEHAGLPKTIGGKKDGQVSALGFCWPVSFICLSIDWLPFRCRDRLGRRSVCQQLF